MNHCPRAVVTATIMDSAPSPNTRRPAAIPMNVPESPVMIAPARQIAVKTSVAVLVPIRSTITPPMSTMMMFGRL